MQEFRLIATCASGMEALVGRELRDLGYQTQVENGRVRFNGTIEDILRANIWLRTADRIKIIVGEFNAYTFDELFEKTLALPWDQLLPMDAEFPVEGKSRNSKLHSVPDVQSIVKKAIVNQLAATYHRNGHLPETGALFPLEVAINKDKVMLTLDTTGSSLFKRGYRLEKGGAPLKENMAAALVLLAKWYSDNPFVDPVCGSGTIPIEAALLARNIAPGIKRAFACEKWDWVPAGLSQDLRDDAKSKINHDIELDISGYDIDGKMIDIARLNAQEAGVLHDINFKQLAVKDFTTDKVNGVIIANPPYGERLSDRDTVRILYRQMGQVYAKLPSWSKYILTSDLEFEDYFGKKATKRRKLYNGALRTDYFQYWGKRIRPARTSD